MVFNEFGSWGTVLVGMSGMWSSRQNNNTKHCFWNNSWNFLFAENIIQKINLLKKKNSNECLRSKCVQMQWKCRKNSRNAIHRPVANKGQSGSMPNVSDIGLQSISFNRWNLHLPSKIHERPWSKQCPFLFCIFQQRHRLEKEASFCHIKEVSVHQLRFSAAAELERNESDIWMHTLR